MLIKTEEIGVMIKSLRERESLTQKDLADKLSITFQAVSKWEKGECYPDLSQIVALSELFKVSVDQLLVEKIATNSVIKKSFRVYQTINSYRFDIKLVNFKINGDTVITVSVHNKSDRNISINPKMFLLMGNGNTIIKPSQSPILKYNYYNDDDEITGTRYKHEIPEFIPPQKDGIIVLYFEQVYDMDYVELFTSLDDTLTNHTFYIPRVFYEGLAMPNFHTYKAPLDIQNCIDFYHANNLVQELINIAFFQNVIPSLNFSQPDVDHTEISFDEYDQLLKKVFKESLFEIENRCKENAINDKSFVMFKHTFMDEEIIKFVSKMWLKYRKLLLEWTIPYLNGSWVDELEEEILQLEPPTILLLLRSKAPENQIFELLFRKVNNYNLEQVVRFIKLNSNSLTDNVIQELILRQDIKSIDDLKMVKPHLNDSIFDKLKTEVIRRII